MESNISVVVPLASDEMAWKTLIQSLEKTEYEIILVCPKVKPLGLNHRIKWIQSKKAQRSHQLNLGAKHAAFNYLWFLHADSKLTDQTITALKNAISKKPEAIHYFQLRFYPKKPFMVFINEYFANLRAYLFQLPFGDQGLCLRKYHFYELGTFDEKKRQAEDFYFIWKAKLMGIEILSTETYMLTSARAYQKNGWLQTTIKRALFTIFHSLRIIVTRRV